MLDPQLKPTPDPPTQPPELRDTDLELVATGKAGYYPLPSYRKSVNPVRRPGY